MPSYSSDQATAFAALTPFDRFLTTDNEVLRSAAYRALVVCRDTAPDAMRAALIGALLDEDPDIRSDAMELLAPIAEPGDAEALRLSLAGDPVREVKLAAISGLARLRDQDSLPLLRSLTVSRTEDQVAWEDDGGDWEEWLDIQTAAIRALGEMQSEEAIDDLVVALMDEFGQSVDVPVFHALVAIGEIGVAALIEIFNQSRGVARRRAATALAGAGAADLDLHVETLLASEEVQLRLLALKALAPSDPRCATLAVEDPDPELRAAALGLAASHAPELAIECLGDADEGVRAVAITCLSDTLDDDFQVALVDNMLVWLERAKPALAITIIEHLPKYAPARSLDALLSVVDDASRSLDVRVAAAKTLNTPELDLTTGMIADRLDNPARQVRATLLTILRSLADSDASALELGARAISGTLSLSEYSTPSETDTLDAGTPKEGSGPSKIWITPDGDIVERDEVERIKGQSTLDSILAAPEVTAPPELAEDTPEESGAKRAKRRAVEGAEDPALSLACDAMTVFGNLVSEAITDAIISRLGDSDDMVRRAAWGALNGCAVSGDILDTARHGFADPDPMIRLPAYLILIVLDDGDATPKALQDEDALIRREAVLRLPANAALDFIGDRDRAVRQAAVTRIAESQDKQLINAATEQAILTERTDTVSDLVVTAPEALSLACAKLAEEGVSARHALIILTAIASI